MTGVVGSNRWNLIVIKESALRLRTLSFLRIALRFHIARRLLDTSLDFKLPDFGWNNVKNGLSFIIGNILERFAEMLFRILIPYGIDSIRHLLLNSKECSKRGASIPLYKEIAFVVCSKVSAIIPSMPPISTGVASKRTLSLELIRT